MNINIMRFCITLFSVILLFGFPQESYGIPQDYSNRGRSGFSFPTNENNNYNNNNRENNVGSFGSNQLTSYESQVQSVQPGVGGTGIACGSPGRFVIAPDGCNRCFCEQNGELSAACSRALCPPGFPSGNSSPTKFSFRRL